MKNIFLFSVLLFTLFQYAGSSIKTIKHPNKTIQKEIQHIPIIFNKILKSSKLSPINQKSLKKQQKKLLKSALSLYKSLKHNKNIAPELFIISTLFKLKLYDEIPQYIQNGLKKDKNNKELKKLLKHLKKVIEKPCEKSAACPISFD